jgi:hypothetical protein
MPAAGAQPAEEAGLAGFFRQVEGLRVELLREVDDLLGADGVVAEFADLADGEIFPVVLPCFW